MKRGRPILGAVMGFLFGLSLGLVLLVFGVVALDSILLVVLPVLWLVLGAVWGKLAPLGAKDGAPAA